MITSSSLVSATPKLDLSKWQNVFDQMYLTPIDYVSLVGVAAIPGPPLYPPLPNFKGNVDQHDHQQDSGNGDDGHAWGEFGLKWWIKDRRLFAIEYQWSPPMDQYIWCEWAKRICSPCPAGLCICVSWTSVFVCARHLYLLLGGGLDLADTDTAGSNTIWLPHLPPTLVCLLPNLQLYIVHNVTSDWVRLQGARKSEN